MSPCIEKATACGGGGGTVVWVAVEVAWAVAVAVAVVAVIFAIPIGSLVVPFWENYLGAYG